MTCPLVDHRAQRKAARHLALADAALRLARERGLDGFTIDDVASAAGTSRRTFFNHFTSKEEAVVEIARAQIGRVLDVVGSADDVGDGESIVDQAIRALLDPVTVEEVRALIGLAEAFPVLVPHLQAVQAEGIERLSDLAIDYLADTAPVYAYAFPGAVVTAVGAVYTGRLHLFEVDGPSEAGDGPPALGIAEFIDQLLSLLPLIARVALARPPQSQHAP